MITVDRTIVQKLRLPVAGGIFALVILGGVLFYLSQPKLYQSSARLWLQSASSVQGSGPLGPQVFLPLSRSVTLSPGATAPEVLKSQIVLSKALEKLKKAYQGPYPTIDELTETLHASAEIQSDIVKVEFVDPNPKAAAEVIKAVIEAFMDLSSDQSNAAARTNVDIARAQVDRATRELDKANKALAKWTDANKVTLADVEMAKNYTMVLRVREEVEGLKKEMAELQNQANLAQAELDETLYVNPDTDSLVQSLRKEVADNEMDMLDLRAQLKDSHPRVIKLKKKIDRTEKALTDRIDDLSSGRAMVAGDQSNRRSDQSKIAAKVSMLASRMQERCSDLEDKEKQLDTLEMLQQKLAEGELAGLLAAKATAEKQLGIAQTALNEAMAALDSASRANNIKVLDYPKVATDPIWPDLLQVMAATFVLATLAALGSYIKLNPAVRSLAEMHKILGLPIAAGLMLSNRKSPEADFVRMSRVMYALKNHSSGSKCIVVTSADTSEGRTPVALALASAFAVAGQRVVLVDCCFKNPMIHKRFGVEAKPGLTEFLAKKDAIPVPDILK
ncbi:MAG: hypothetical protein K2Z81_14905, partial [Cyanobacteria bacterium]|nr:hypothetical protein [Cyanobacteriota bacterium]